MDGLVRLVAIDMDRRAEELDETVGQLAPWQPGVEAPGRGPLHR